MHRYQLLASAALFAATPAFAQVSLPASVAIDEGKIAVVTATRRAGIPKGKTLSFTYRTVAETALPGQDFVARSGSQSIRKNANSYTLNIQTIDDAAFEQDERLFLEVVAAGITTRVPIVIRDNDVAPIPEPPIVDPVPLPPPTEPTPAPDPINDGYVKSPGLKGLQAVADKLNVNDFLYNASVATKSAAPDVVGAFRFDCYSAHFNNDDTLVYHGQPGKSHGHQNYGNTALNAYSTYESLRETGDSTCMNVLNRSGYWAPAMTDGKNYYRVHHDTIYYKRRPISDPKCSLTSGDPKAEGNCVDSPNGLRFIFGYDMLTGKTPPGAFYFMCSTGTVASPDSGHKPTLTAAMAICPTGARVHAIIKSPTCWDGVNLDSPNHRDHVAYIVRDPNTGINACPKTHPFVVPAFTLNQTWLVTPELKQAANEGTLRFTSDDHVPNAAAGTTYHGDWFGAWNDQILAMWHDNCINKMLNCSDGDLGNGKKLRNDAKAKYGTQPQVVPIPSGEVGAH